MEDKGYGEGDTHARWIWRKDTISYSKTPTNTQNIEMKYGQQWEIWRRKGDDGKMSLVQVDFSLEIGMISHPKTLENNQKQMKTNENSQNQPKTSENTPIYLNIPKNSQKHNTQRPEKTPKNNPIKYKEEKGVEKQREGDNALQVANLQERAFFFTTYHLDGLD